MRKNKDFRLTWAVPMTRRQWRDYLKHDETSVSRLGVYEILQEHLDMCEPGPPLSFAEVGFGTCYDFAKCFRALHDRGEILYTGYDVTAQFARYARGEYPGYDFRQGDFLDLGERQYGITYTRHTFLHLDPGLWQGRLRALLDATRYLCIVCWRMSPGETESLHWSADTGYCGAWTNRYSKHDVARIVEEAGFDCEIVEFGQGKNLGVVETVYVMTRGPDAD